MNNYIAREYPRKILCKIGIHRSGKWIHVNPYPPFEADEYSDTWGHKCRVCGKVYEKKGYWDLWNETQGSGDTGNEIAGLAFLIMAMAAIIMITNIM